MLAVPVKKQKYTFSQLLWVTLEVLTDKILIRSVAKNHHRPQGPSSLSSHVWPGFHRFKAGGELGMTMNLVVLFGGGKFFESQFDSISRIVVVNDLHLVF